MLAAASLMMGEPAAGDAVERARRLPGLRVGLHLTLADGRAVLPYPEIPELVTPEGRFRDNLVGAGFAYFFRPAVRRQLRAEIRAQFAAYRATGLALDHADAHHHLHLHPTVLGLMLEAGRDYGLRAVRLPREPALPGWHATRAGAARGAAMAAFLAPWSGLMRWRLRRAGIRSNDYLFGMNDTGRMALERVLRLIELLPEGVTEIHFHPTVQPAGRDENVRGESGRSGSSKKENEGNNDELSVLLNPKFARSLEDRGIERICFSDLE